MRLNERDLKILMLLGKGYDQTEMGEIVGMHQPALAKRVRLIEKEIGPLMLRVGAKMTLNSKRTVFGSRVAVLAEEATKIFAAIRQIDKYQQITPDILARDLRALADSVEVSFCGESSSACASRLIVEVEK
jgi:hypothetical protein